MHFAECFSFTETDNFLSMGNFLSRKSAKQHAISKRQVRGHGNLLKWGLVIAQVFKVRKQKLLCACQGIDHQSNFSFHPLLLVQDREGKRSLESRLSSRVVLKCRIAFRMGQITQVHHHFCCKARSLFRNISRNKINEWDARKIERFELSL